MNVFRSPKTQRTALCAVVSSLAMLAGSACLAQSNNSWYGVIDTNIRSQDDDPRDSLEAGLIQGSRLGFRGDHAMPNGWSALYNFEAGVNPVSGQSGQQGQLFGRQAWVGLKGQQGQLTAGRQFGIAFDMVGENDPYGIANAAPIAWQFNLFGARFDNTLKWKGEVGNFKYSAATSFGNQPGDANSGRTVGLGAGYKFGMVSATLGMQQSTDSRARLSKSVFAGGKATLGTTTLYAALVNTKRDQGFAPCANNNVNPTTSPLCTNGPLANTNLATGFAQGDATTNYYQIGFKVRFNENWELGGAYMKDSTSVDNAPTSVFHETTYAILDYYFDKDTDIYAGIDLNKVSDNGLGNGAYANYGVDKKGTSQTGVSVGFRYRF